MALTAAQVQQCKHWLGYGNLTAVAIPYFDISLVFEEVIATNLEQTWAEPYLTNTILPNLLQLDIDIMACRTRFQALVLVGDVELNPKEMDRLLDLQWYWIKQLSSTIKIEVANGPGSLNGGSSGGIVLS